MTETVVQIDTGRLTHAFLLRGHAGQVLVDTGYPNCAGLILRAFSQHVVAPEDVRLILITRLVTLDPRLVCVGHGGPFDAEDLASLVKKQREEETAR